jgi:hypothetical protein
MSAVFDLAARRAAQPRDARSVLDALADGVAQIDAQVHSLAFCVLREERVAAVARNVELLLGLCAELRGFVSAKE